MSRPKISLTVDGVVFGYDPTPKVSVLLVKRKYDPYKDLWAIPGGFVEQNESLEEAVYRELQEETGVKISYLEQLYTFGTPDRDPRGRVVSVAYFGLVKPDSFKVEAASDAKDVRWFDIKELPKLAFDHTTVLDIAIQRLRAKITYEPIGFELLDERFPFSDLENLYTTLLGRSIDRRNFRKKILSFGMLDELEEKVKKGAGRPANLFQFNEERYFQLKKEGIIFEI